MKGKLQRILPIFLAFTLCLLCSCGAKGSFGKNDLVILVDGTAVTADMSVDRVLEILDAAYGEREYAEAISCVYEGMDKTYTYENAVLYTYPGEKEDRLMEVTFDGGSVQTEKGIRIGSSREDILTAYGEHPTVETGSMISYELPSSGSDSVPASLYFLMRDGVVETLAVVAEHRAE